MPVYLFTPLQNITNIVKLSGRIYCCVIFIQALLDLLLPHHKRFREQIGEVLDMELIKQKAEHEALNLKYYAEFVISTMTKLCAPARDEQIAKLKDINDVVPLFRSVSGWH